MSTMMNDIELGISGRMKAARLLKGLEQAEVAEALGVARTTVSAWERGASEPSATNFARWAVITGQPMEWLAGSVVRPKGLEPLTFWLGVFTRIRAAILARRIDAEYEELCASESAR